MRINKFVAQATGLSRRAADRAIEAGQVAINQKTAVLGDNVNDTDEVTLDKRRITPPVKTQTIMLNKPVGYICSREGQGGKTIYDLLPRQFHHLKPVGRLDKHSSGLVLLTNDGSLAHQLTHPRYAKRKIYEIKLDRALLDTDHKIITGHGVTLEDGPSKLQLHPLDSRPTSWRVTMSEGRNRQIRRTFAALNYKVTNLHRTHFGKYELGDIDAGKYSIIATQSD